MALTKCKECGAKVSTKAESCPACGAPVKKKPRQYGCFSLIVVLTVLFVGLSQVLDSGPSSVSRPTQTSTPARPSSPPGETYWVTSDRLNRRTCPSTDCGVVGVLMFRERAGVFESRDGWARVTKYYNAACENGKSRFVDSGNSSCTPDNGVNNGQFAEWVSMSLLSKTRPPDPSAGATGTDALVAKSDDYRIHKDAFVTAANELIRSGRCTAKDISDNGGWVKSTSSPNEPVYFTYCKGYTRYYLNAETGQIFQ
jgi:hypothetical protein